MTQYILLIHNNTRSDPTPEEWESFFEAAKQSGVFRGGSEIGERELIGDTQAVTSSDHITGYMRFDSEDKEVVLELLQKHPIVIHSGTVELCVMPKS